MKLEMDFNLLISASGRFHELAIGLLHLSELLVSLILYYGHRCRVGLLSAHLTIIVHF